MNPRWLWLCAPVCAAGGFFFGSTGRELARVAPAFQVANAKQRSVENERQPAAEFDSHAGAAQPVGLAMSHASHLHRTHALLELIAHLSPDEFAGTADAALSLPRDLATEALRLIYEEWAKRDPRAACEHSRAKAHFWEISGVAARVWVHRDPTAALTWGKSLPRRERSSMLFDVRDELTTMARENPKTILPLLLGSPDLLAEPRIGSRIFRDWAERDPGAAAAQALAMTPKWRAEALKAVAEGWSKQNPRAALEWLEQNGSEQLVRDTRPAVIAAWAERDATGAAAYARARPTEKERNTALAIVATAMLARDPAGAAELAGTLPLRDFLSNRTFYQRWAQKDARAAAEDFGKRSGGLTETGESQEWQDECFKNIATDILRPFASRDAKAAAEFAVGQPERARKVFLEEALWKWMDRDRDAALAWASAQPLGATRDDAYEIAAQTWAQTSTNETAAWLGTLPAGPSRDAAVKGFATRVLRFDAASALEWLRTIPDSQRREAALIQAWKEWPDGEDEPAQRWLENSPDLTPTERAALRRENAKESRSVIHDGMRLELRTSDSVQITHSSKTE